ncbi:MAG: hypothetical protein DRG30_05115 [Epsilonproteobacteria bacterium]|nr:MAG: hypothetical protein DRG30_05115 [Campylobacterota bacterium]
MEVKRMNSGIEIVNYFMKRSDLEDIINKENEMEEEYRKIFDLEKPSEMLLNAILGKTESIIITHFDVDAYNDKARNIGGGDGFISYTSVTTIKETQGKIHIEEFLRAMKDWIMNIYSGQNLSSHRTFYTQTDGRDWYAGFNRIKTTYDDKCTYRDLGKGKTEVNAVIDMLEDIISGKVPSEEPEEYFSKLKPKQTALEAEGKLKKAEEKRERKAKARRLRNGTK